MFFRSAPAEGDQPPPLTLDDAHHTVVVVLVDAKMLLARAAWQAWLTPLWQAAQACPERHRVFHVSLTPNSFQAARDQSHPPPHRTRRGPPGILLNRLTNDLARLITQRPTVEQVEDRRS